MVYGIIGMINFAHGEIYMIGAFVSLLVITLLASIGLPIWLVIVLALLISAAVTALYGMAVERVAYRPLRLKGAPRLVPLITAIGMSIFLTNYVQLGHGARDFSFPQLIPGGINFGIYGDTVRLSYTRLLVLVTTLVMMTALSLFIRKSRTGKACRACSQDIQMAGLLGIDTNKIVTITFIIGAILAAVGGLLIGLVIGKINPYMGFIAGMKAFTAAVIGGIGSVPGAMLGGLLLGLVETFAADLLPGEYKDMVTFSLLMFILLVRPTGLLGKPDIDKV
ncbi:branched-chain amino acid ABC transporter permease [Gammaproteobacteria bacterium]|nr:branched-chain amino acid ABC transporter permease [Gammaproteobacteria bacterium]